MLIHIEKPDESTHKHTLCLVANAERDQLRRLLEEYAVVEVGRDATSGHIDHLEIEITPGTFPKVET